MMNMEEILELVKDERGRQDEKWGEQNHGKFKWLAILGEEVGEANKAVLENDLQNTKEELIQIAATAVAFLESIERNTNKHDYI